MSAFSVWKGAGRELARRIKERPVLAIAPAASVAISELITYARLRGVGAVVAGYAAFCATNAACAEIWNAADGGFDDDRFAGTLAVYLIPCPFLIALAFFSASLVYDVPAPSVPALFAQAYVMRAAACLLAILSALSVRGLARGKGGALGALRGGARISASNAGLVLAAVLGSFALDHLVGVLWESWRAGAYGVASSGIVAAALFKAWLSTAATMLFVVVLPLQARASGLLEEN